MSLHLGLLRLLPAVALAGCSTAHEFRVASVGSGSGAAAAAPSGPSPSVRPPSVVSGNVILGRGVGFVPAAAQPGVVRGTVTGVLGPTGQTLVQLRNGTSLVVNAVGGALGDVVSINLAQGQVVGGPTSLVGVSIGGGTHSAGGQLVGVSVGGALVGGSSGGSNSLLPVNAGQALGTVSSSVTKITQPVTSTVTTLGGALTHLCC
jgi:hypothetical protein